MPPADASIPGVIRERARTSPAATAIAAPGRRPLSYARLQSQVRDVGRRLNGLGLGGDDRIAVVLPNGPEIATAFLSVASAAACAPLNPACRTGEFEFLLSDLDAKALIVQEGMGDSAAAAARKHGIPVLTLFPALQEEAGIFTLAGDGTATGTGASPLAGDVALVLHTSGTTSRPKLVPLTHFNLCAAADGIRETLRLDASDRCLNVMPMFHIHGLSGALLSSISAGASVVCPGAFNASGFFEWLREFRPTWYTAVPAIHQSILAASVMNREALSGAPLRFIRSCSAPLPRRLLDELEAAFHIPVIEAYGMTEASHQVTSNPLPPGIRKPGSVGKAAGPAVAVLDEAGNALGAGKTGEVAIRGSGVTGGYGNNPAANEKAFVNGWFRTGDLGHIDRDGYLFLEGRLKEIINRGGFKVSPREVDDVLLQHPKVAQAVAFGIPHAALGEDVAAAVVPTEPGSVSERELRDFALSRLAEYKAPTRVLILDEIPKGPTGKPRRSTLAKELEDLLKADFRAPRDELESCLKEIWQSVLDVELIGIRDNFFDLGGHSLLAVELFTRIEERFGKPLPLSTLFHAPTIEELADVIRGKGEASPWDYLVPIRPGGSRPPFFCVHPHDGNVFGFRNLAAGLKADQPFYGLQAKVPEGMQLSDLKIGELARNYVEEIRRLQPEGPYFLGGECLGGPIAVEMARRLLESGEKVALVALILSYAPGYPKPKPGMNFLRSAFCWIRTEMDRAMTMYPLVDPSERWGYFRDMMRYNARFLRDSVAWARYKLFPSFGDSYIRRLDDHARRLREWINVCPVDGYPGRLTLFRMEKDDHMKFIPTDDWGWGRIAAGGLEVHVLPGYAHIYGFENVQRRIAEKLAACLERAQDDGARG